jgi:hypothetical protein
MLDAPTGAEKLARLTAFLDRHHDIRDNNRAHTLPTTGLEGYFHPRYVLSTPTEYQDKPGKGARQCRNAAAEQEVPAVLGALSKDGSG